MEITKNNQPVTQTVPVRGDEHFDDLSRQVQKHFGRPENLFTTDAKDLFPAFLGALPEFRTAGSQLSFLPALHRALWWARADFRRWVSDASFVGNGGRSSVSLRAGDCCHARDRESCSGDGGVPFLGTDVGGRSSRRQEARLHVESLHSDEPEGLPERAQDGGSSHGREA